MTKCTNCEVLRNELDQSNATLRIVKSNLKKKENQNIRQSRQFKIKWKKELKLKHHFLIGLWEKKKS